MAVTIVLLMIVGFLLLFLEIFLPGGVLGVLGGIMLLSGIVLSFKEFGSTEAVLMFIATIFISTIIMYSGIKLFPRSPLGRRIVLKLNVGKKEGYSSQEIDIHILQGKSGVAISTLRPSGMADFEGRRVDVVTEGEYIENGARVVVTKVDGNRVVVDRFTAT